jgi:hypothetical protein
MYSIPFGVQELGSVKDADAPNCFTNKLIRKTKMKKTTTHIVSLMVAIFLAGCGDPEDVNITLELPLNVIKGDEFVIVTTV